MSDPISQPTVGAPASVSQEPSQQAEQATETKPLTIADVERIAEEKAIRIAQSMVDKAENRISKKAQEQIKAIDASRQVLNLSDEDARAAKQRIIYDDLAGQPTAEQASPATQPQQNQQPELHPIVQEFLDITGAAGVEIREGSAEWNEFIKPTWTDPNANVHQIRRAIYTAVDKVKERQASNADQAAARTVGGGTSNNSDGATNLSGRDYLQRAHRK